MPPPPPLVLAWLAADLPDAPDARRQVVTRLDAAARARGRAAEGATVARSPDAQTAYDARQALYVWAHGEAPVRPGETAPTLAAWGAVLGLTAGTIKAARRTDATLAALPHVARGKPRTATPSPVTVRVRAKRARDAERPKRGRPKKDR